MNRDHILDLGSVLISLSKTPGPDGSEMVSLAHSSIKDYILHTANRDADNGFPEHIQSASSSALDPGTCLLDISLLRGPQLRAAANNSKNIPNRSVCAKVQHDGGC